MIFQQKLSKPERNVTVHLKWWQEEPTAKNTLPSKALIQIWWRNQNLSRQTEVNRIQDHRTSFTTNVKGTSLGSKHKRRKRPTEHKPKIIKKMVIWSYTPINYLKCKWIKCTNQRHRLAALMKTNACMYFHLPYHSAWPPKLCLIVLYC